MQLSTHHDAQTVVWGGWGPIVDIHVHMEIKYQWIVVYAYVMLVMLVRYFNYELRARCYGSLGVKSQHRALGYVKR